MSKNSKSAERSATTSLVGVNRRSFLIASAAALSMPAVATTGVPFRTVWVDPKSQTIGLHWKDESGKPFGTVNTLLNDLRDKGEDVQLICNAGIYGSHNKPLGLHIENGRELKNLNQADSGGNFYLLPNGVFWIDADGAHVARTNDYARRRPKGVIAATQSGPLLFDHRGLHPRFLKRSKSLYLRNGVGVRDDGKVAFTISTELVNFHHMATYMRDKLGCEAGLYLDGGISQQWQPGWPIFFQFSPFVGMISVTNR